MLDDKQTANCSLRLQKRNKQTKDSRYRSIYNRKWPTVRFSNNIARDRWLREGGKLSQRHFELFYTSRVSTIKRVTFIIFTLRLMLFYVSPRMNINLAYIFTDNVMLLVSRSMYVCMYIRVHLFMYEFVRRSKISGENFSNGNRMKFWSQPY